MWPFKSKWEPPKGYTAVYEGGGRYHYLSPEQVNEHLVRVNARLHQELAALQFDRDFILQALIDEKRRNQTKADPQ